MLLTIITTELFFIFLWYTFKQFRLYDSSWSIFYVTSDLNIKVFRSYWSNDSAVPMQSLFQDESSPTMGGLIDFHHSLTFYLFIIVVFVLYFSTLVLKRTLWLKKESTKGLRSNHAVEIAWTLVPAFFLVLVTVPSFSLLFSSDETISPCLSVKVIGHQWYWSYELRSFYMLGFIDFYYFDSYILGANALLDYSLNLRLLEVDALLCLPYKIHVKLLVTSTDVLHSFTIPSTGVKLDACPGRLNQTVLFINRPGTYYGQCSEICGVNHGFMPVVIKSFNNYLKQSLLII